LTWITASEIGNDYFTIEKSKEGDFWKEVGKVDGKGESSQKNHYLFLDVEASDDFTYYRLKQTDFDGKYSYSNIVRIVYETNESTREYNVYPNPFVNYIIVTGSVLNLEELKILNMQGQNLVGLAEVSVIDDLNIKIDFSNLRQGIYSIEIAGFITRVLKY
jgi:hypothetical protein